MQLCFKIRRSARKRPGKSAIAKKSEQKNCPIRKIFGSIRLEIQWENVWVLYNFALKRMVNSEIDPKKMRFTKNFLKTYIQMFKMFENRRKHLNHTKFLGNKVPWQLNETNIT